MRLLNARTFKLHTELGQKKPRYVILSHTWEEEEVLFEDINSASSTTENEKRGFFKESKPAPDAKWKEKKGFFKIKNTCKQALRDGYDFVWVDTCCINKDSSAELSEAINSMFRWYQEADICYAYLSDLQYRSATSLSRCRWFERGWTLQELIAPDHVHFYGSGWTYLGSRISLSSGLSRITGIPEAILTRRHEDQKASHRHKFSPQPLLGSCSYCSSANVDDTRSLLNSLSVANRMRWASKRVTTRTEDIAYCLMGLFDVNMPLLYGEGSKSFYRLQNAILETSNDHSIFAFRSQALGIERLRAVSSILAYHPSFFRDDIQNEWTTFNGGNNLTFTGNTLSVDMLLCRLKKVQLGDARIVRYIGILDSMIDGDCFDRPAILLETVDGRHFHRIGPISQGAALYRVRASEPTECVQIVNDFLETTSKLALTIFTV
jgi:hypothetical protein